MRVGTVMQILAGVDATFVQSLAHVPLGIRDSVAIQRGIVSTRFLPATTGSVDPMRYPWQTFYSFVLFCDCCFGFEIS